MKFIFKIFILCFITVLISSCESYLDRQEDEAMTFDKIWLKRVTTEGYLAGIYTYLPDETDWVDETGWIGASDEASNVFNRGYRHMNFGTWNPSNIPYSNKNGGWTRSYIGIREANVFMQNVDRCLELSDKVREQFKAEARFIRAYMYFLMMRVYGPVILVGDEIIDFNQSTGALAWERNTWEECMEYVVTELEECSKILLDKQPPLYYGKPTKGVALAVISRLKLYSARPLFNGNDLYSGIKTKSGKQVFSITYDANKWKAAADAGLALITHAEHDGVFELHYDKSNDPHKSYEGVFLDKWNKELIFGQWRGGYVIRRHLIPSVMGGAAYGGVGPTQEQVDAYAMKSGVYPITGYSGNGVPIIDPQSGYTETGFTPNYVHPLEGTYSTTEADKGNVPNMYMNREPRFYATVFWSGGLWPNPTAKYPIFHKAGNSSLDNDYTKTGYMLRKYVDRTLATQNGQWGNVTYPLFRLAEIYLNYIEALNEYDPGHGHITYYLNKIRKRAGVPDIETVYPGAVGNKDLMRELIRKERRVELAFENHRYFDTRTWMIATDTDNGPKYGMNRDAVGSANINPANYWQRAVFETRTFQPKHYLFPFSQRELDRNENLIYSQNYGW